MPDAKFEVTREEKKRGEVPKRRKQKQRRGKRLARGEAKGRWNDGVIVGWPEKKKRAEKQRRNEAKKNEAEKREESRSKRSISRILTLLMGKLSKVTKSLIFPSQH